MNRRILFGIVWLFAMVVTFTDTGCGSTGSKRFEFDAFAGGHDTPAFTNAKGWTIALTKARITFGPVYLNVVPPLRTSWLGFDLVRHAHAADAHLAEGRRVGEVLGQISLDALSSNLVRFDTQGTMTQEEIRTAEVWLWPAPGTAPETVKIDTAAVDLAGTALRGGISVRFRGELVFDGAWATDAVPGERSATPITDQRMVRGIPASFYPNEGGHLEIRFDMKPLLAGADFSDLDANPTDADGTKILLQAKAGAVTTDQVMKNIFQGLRAANGTYYVRWVMP